MTQNSPSRRTFLAGLGTVGITAAAGCLSVSGDDSPQTNQSDTQETDESQDSTGETLPLTGNPGVVNLADQGYESTLRTVSARHQIVTESSSSGPVEIPEVWAWQADDLDPSVPGPRFVVPEGEDFQLNFENNHERPHTVHVHAITKTWENDGAPIGGAGQVNPGDSFTYEYTADVPGPHFYHCHVQTDTHLDMGMYGFIYVQPENERPADREYFLTLRDWDTQLHESHVSDDVDYDPRERSSNEYTINGRAAPSTFHPEQGTPLLVESGDRVRLHLGNAGYESHPFHTHGHRFEVVRKDGTLVPESARYKQDVVEVAPAERITIEFDADSDPGIWPAHCHKAHHVTTEGKYPGGMATAIVYDSVTDTDEFAATMRAAGFEG
jgi:FtsP/CotA-like multicopper oxidase with cupredoxin domain